MSLPRRMPKKGDKWEPMPPNQIEYEGEYDCEWSCRKCKKMTPMKILCKGFCSQECLDSFTEEDFSEEEYENGYDFETTFVEDFE